MPTITPIASNGFSKTVHLGYDLGTHLSKPFCGKLAKRETETTDDPANCRDCIAHAFDCGHDLQDLVALSPRVFALVDAVRAHANAYKDDAGWAMVVGWCDYEIATTFGKRVRSPRGAIMRVDAALEADR